MQDPKKINITSGVISNGKTYSVEFHADNYDTKVKVVDNGVASFHSMGGAGVTYTAGTGININSGVISSTVTDTDTNNFINNVSLNGTTLDFTGSGGSFTGAVSLSSLASAEANTVAYVGGTINTDSVSLYSLRDEAEKIVLTRSVGTDVNFVLEANTTFLNTLKFGILTVQVTINTTGGGGISLRYKDLTGSTVPLIGAGTPAGSGNVAITFGYFGGAGLQLIAVSEY